MARYGIDAVTLLHLVDTDATIDVTHQLVAPNAIRSDVLQLLLHDVRAGRRSEKDALAVHTKVTELKMRLLGDRVSRATAWRIARVHDWDSIRPAEYLAVAQLQADALVTVDQELAARAKAIVPIKPFSVLLRGSRATS